MRQASSAASTSRTPIDWTADNRGKYVSIDGGDTAGALFSNGLVHGDGRQASHWKDGLVIGPMDPTAGLGETLTISQNDLLAMDAIGWDVTAIAEPSSWAMPGAGMLLPGGRALRASAWNTELFRQNKNEG